MNRWIHLPTTVFFFLDKVAAIDSTYGNFAYLHSHWARNECYRWTKFTSEKKFSCNIPRAHRAKQYHLKRSSGFNSYTSCILFAKSFHTSVRVVDTLLATDDLVSSLRAGRSLFARILSYKECWVSQWVSDGVADMHFRYKVEWFLNVMHS